ncbi:MAG: TRAP transporter large permease subunit [Acetobacteraceae bacterium]|nr:TRAP transporter large permease subunit [Acetobacteraceae bacterium]
MEVAAAPRPAPDGAAARAAALVSRLLDGGFGALATACLVAMIAIVGAGVVARYVFNASLSWSEEVSIWLFLFIIFLGLPLAVTRGMSLSLGGLEARLSGLPLAVLRFLNDCIVAYALVMLATGGRTVMRLVGGVTPVLAMPQAVPYAVLSACAVAALVAHLCRLDAGGRLSPARALSVAVGVAAWALLHEWPVYEFPDARPSLVAFLAFLVVLLMGVPVAIAMLFGVFAARLVGAPIPEAGLVQQMVVGSSKFLLLAIPFFLAAGALMGIGGLTRRIIEFAERLVGHIRGGVGQVNIATATMFAGISGSSISEAAIASKLLAREMVRNGYPMPVACAMIAAASVLPNIIPPSIALLLLAASVNLSVADLWLGGVLPGLLLAATLMAATYLLARVKGYGIQSPRASLSEMGRAGLRAAPILFLVVIILGGIRFGLVTPTEAGVLAVAYAAFLGLAVYREFRLAEMLRSLSQASVEIALVGLVIGAAGPFAFLFIAERIPQELASLVTAWVDSRLMLLLLVNLLLLLCGMVLDIGVAILVLTPILMPLALQFGVDPVHFGIIVTVNLMLGGLTPPVGILVYVTASVTGTPADRVFRAVLPLLAAMLLALAAITLVPALSLALVR